MLLIARRPNESIQIGDDIKVTVLNSSKKQIQLGIEAPEEMPVHRQEIYQKINGTDTEKTK